MIGLFGGVFDPIHNGHLYLADQLNQQMKFDQFHFIPCKQQVLKQEAQASSEQRLAMLQLALEDRKHYQINRIEIDRDTPSYTYETIATLQQQMPNQTLYFILGIDSFLTLPKWHRADELCNLCRFIVIPRDDLIISNELRTKAGLIYYCAEMAPFNLSSTIIRDRIAQKLSIEDCVPAKVWQYIQSQHLYGS